MEAGGNPNLLIAADSNVPLDLADDNESAVDAIDTIRSRLPHARFVISPSVFQELVHVALRDPLPIRQQLGIRTLQRLKIWRFDLLEIHGPVHYLHMNKRTPRSMPFRKVRSRSAFSGD